MSYFKKLWSNPKVKAAVYAALGALATQAQDLLEKLKHAF